MKTFKQFINEGSKYIGQCDKVRHDDAGEQFWQNMMNNKIKISQKEFLKNVNPKNILDPGESFSEWVENASMSDPDFAFYKSTDDVYFIQSAGFEFIWKKV